MSLQKFLIQRMEQVHKEHEAGEVKMKANKQNIETPCEDEKFYCERLTNAYEKLQKYEDLGRAQNPAEVCTLDDINYWSRTVKSLEKVLVAIRKKNDGVVLSLQDMQALSAHGEDYDSPTYEQKQSGFVDLDLIVMLTIFFGSLWIVGGFVNKVSEFFTYL